MPADPRPKRWEDLVRRLAYDASLGGRLGWWVVDGLVRLAFRGADAAHIAFHSPTSTTLAADCVEQLRILLRNGHDPECEAWRIRARFRNDPDCGCGYVDAKAALEALDASISTEGR